MFVENDYRGAPGNDADIDRSRVVFARVLSPADDARLMEYYKDRTVWRTGPKYQPVLVRPAPRRAASLRRLRINEFPGGNRLIPARPASSGTEMAEFRYEICVVGGCGHVGLPLAITFAGCGVPVSVYDINDRAVEMVNSGRMPFIEAGAEPKLREVIGRTLAVSTDPSCVAQSRFVIVVIGTPVDEHLNPTFHAMRRFFRGSFRSSEAASAWCCGARSILASPRRSATSWPRPGSTLPLLLPRAGRRRQGDGRAANPAADRLRL